MDSKGVQVQEVQFAQMEHHLGYAAGEEDLHGGMSLGPVRQDIDKPWHICVDALPIGDCGAGQSGSVRDSGNMEQQIGRPAKGGVDDHGVVKSLLGKNIGAGDLIFV